MPKQSRKLRPLPTVALIETDGELTPISLTELENDVKKLINHVYKITKQELTYPKAIKIKQTLDEKDWEREETAKTTGKNNPNLKPNEEGRQAGLNYTKTCPKEIKAKDRTNRLIRYEIVSKLKKWDKTLKNLPQAGKSINLGAIDSQMATLSQQGNHLIMEFKPYDKSYYIIFNIPKGMKNKKVSLPNININKQTGKLQWNFTFEEKIKLPPISSDYVIGVDRGKKIFATWSVINTKTGKPVAFGKNSDQVQHILGKIKRLQKETQNLQPIIQANICKLNIPTYNKYRKQYNGKLKKITELKNKVCLLLAEEVIAVSQLYDNAIIVLEDLSWSGNWNSRVPFGLLKQRISELAERVGTHVQLVNAAYTSQNCSNCKATRSGWFDKRIFVCKECRLRIDRDINAAINIALRGLINAVKSSRTRDKYKKTNKQVKLNHNKKIKIILYDFKNGTAGVQWNTDSVTSGDLNTLNHIIITFNNQTQTNYHYRL